MDENKDVCAVCKKPIEEGQHCIRLAMGQWMHIDCISKKPMRHEE